MTTRPPYFDPNTGQRFDTSNPTMQGYLTKQSAWLKDWRRRFFILKNSKLFFSKSEYGAPHGNQNKIKRILKMNSNGTILYSLWYFI